MARIQDRRTLQLPPNGERPPVLYLLRPDLTIYRNGSSSALILDRAGPREEDLGGMEWEPAHRQWDRHTLPLALRHGVPCPLGIVVPTNVLTAFDRPQDLVEAFRALADSVNRLQVQGNRGEGLKPESWEQRRRLQRDADETTHQAIIHAEREAEALMEDPPDPALVEHWRSLNGPTF